MSEPRPTDRTLTPEAVTAVGLSRGMCYGTCPVYTVALTTGGDVTYEGEAFVERVGRHHGEAEPDSVADLIRIILRLGFTDLEPEYPPPATCMPSHELTLWQGQRPWRVVDHGGAPTEFWAMAALVDAVVAEVWWDEEGDDVEEADAEEAGDADESPERSSTAHEPPADDVERPAPAGQLERRADGKVYCCKTLGWVDEDTAFEHHWDTSRPLEEYLSERAHHWDRPALEK